MQTESTTPVTENARLQAAEFWFLFKLWRLMFRNSAKFAKQIRRNGNLYITSENVANQMEIVKADVQIL